MNLQQLKYFKIAAETENYTTAAKRLGITQSNLSHAISSLERELGVALFEKQGRNIQISQNGREFYHYASKALDILAEGKERMTARSQPQNTTIRIGHLHNTARDFFPQVIRQYRSKNKHVIFKFEQGPTLTLLEAMRSQELDLSLISKVDIDNMPGNFCFVPVYEEELVVIVPKQHRLAGRVSVELSELDGEKFAAYDKKSGLHHLIMTALKSHDIQVHITSEEILDSSICRSVSTGSGIAIVPKTMDLFEYDLKALPISKESIRRLIYLCWRTDSVRSEHIEDFIHFIRDTYEIS